MARLNPIEMVPRPMLYVATVLLILGMVPPALIAWARATPSAKPRIHFVQDMDNQHKLKAQHASPAVEGVPLFRDGRAMRPPVPGTVARGELGADDHYHRGLVGGQWAQSFPPQVDVDRPLLERGRDRFDIYCAVCHGQAGYGDGIVHQRAMQLVVTPGLSKGTTWVAPKSLHEQAIRDQPLGQLFNTVTNGVRTMPAYEAQIPLDDRWAIVAYVQALQRSQHARPQDVEDPERLPVGFNDLPIEESP